MARLALTFLSEKSVSDPQLKDQLLLARLVQALGSEGFRARAFELVQAALGADHIVVYCVGGDQAGGQGSHGHHGHHIRGLFTEGRLPARVAQTINQRYIERYYMLDQNLAALREVALDAPPVVLRVAPQDMRSPIYQQYFYGRTGLREKLCIASRTQAGLLLCNVYRLAASGRFGSRDMVRARRLAPVLTACVWQQLAWLDGERGVHPLCATEATEPPPTDRAAAKEALAGEQQLLRRLSARETDVCRRLLAGASNEAAALDLGISVHTVRTLRKRLYKKLHVNSLGDLYARYLGAMGEQVSRGG